MPTFKHDIVVQQGAAFKLNIQARNSNGTPRPLVGYSAAMQVRSTVDDSIKLVDASTANGKITINGPGGIVMINVSAVETTAMTWVKGVWDLEISTGITDVERIAEGFASFSPEVTR
jgi:hypothetical protein